MKTRTSYFVLILFLLLLAVASTQAQTTNADFQQAVTAYQQSPNDLNKAEKVIRMAAAMPQPPPIPEEARRLFVRGTALFKDAKSPDDFKQVTEEFQQAVRLAPWWPDARYNLALALDAAGDYASAIANIKLYLHFKLPDADARSAQDKIYAIEAKQEKAAKASAPKAVVEKQHNEYRDWLKKIDGARYVRQVNTNRDAGTFWVDIHGDTMTYGVYTTWSKFSPENVGKYIQWGAGKIVGKAIEWHETVGVESASPSFTGRISEDGNTLVLQERGWSNIVENIYHRER